MICMPACIMCGFVCSGLLTSFEVCESRCLHALLPLVAFFSCNCVFGPRASQVSDALSRLDVLEAGYRAFHAAMTDIVRAFPRKVQEANDRCGALGCFRSVTFRFFTHKGSGFRQLGDAQ